MRDIDTCHVALQVEVEAQEEAQEPCRRPLQRGPCISPRGSALIDPSAPEVWPVARLAGLAGLLVAGLLQIPPVSYRRSVAVEAPRFSRPLPPAEAWHSPGEAKPRPRPRLGRRGLQTGEAGVARPAGPGGVGGGMGRARARRGGAVQGIGLVVVVGLAGAVAGAGAKGKGKGAAPLPTLHEPYAIPPERMEEFGEALS